MKEFYSNCLFEAVKAKIKYKKEVKKTYSDNMEALQMAIDMLKGGAE